MCTCMRANARSQTHTIFSFLPSYTSLPHDWVISYTTTNGLLASPRCALLLHPEGMLWPQGTDFLHDLHSSRSSVTILSVYITTYPATGKRKRKIVVTLFLKRKRGAWCARRYSKQESNSIEPTILITVAGEVFSSSAHSVIPCGFSWHLARWG